MLLTLLAILIALAIATFLAFCLPVWASLSITAAAVLAAAVGGAALLAKTAVAGVFVGGALWLWRRRDSRRMPAEAKLAAIPEARTKDPQVRRNRADRRAA